MPQTTSSETTVGRNWTWLEKRKLVRTERDRRIRKAILLMEDGSGRDFERATGQGRGYFNLPYEYFTERWHLKLKLAGKATLLICLAQSPTFTLPTEPAASWYGVSADTLQRGLDELRDLELLKTWSRAKKAPRTRFGYTVENHYALRGPFVRAAARLATPARRRRPGIASSSRRAIPCFALPCSECATVRRRAPPAATRRRFPSARSRTSSCCPCGKRSTGYSLLASRWADNVVCRPPSSRRLVPEVRLTRVLALEADHCLWSLPPTELRKSEDGVSHVAF